jgi:hypothetical protein
MESATKLLRRYRFAKHCVSHAQLVQAVWPKVVGKKVAEHSEIRGLWHGTLIVQVEDPIWQEHLTTLRGQILVQLVSLVGAGLVTEIEFRVGVPRRKPAREERVAAAEPDGIEDPILSRIYLASKKRASA